MGLTILLSCLIIPFESFASDEDWKEKTGDVKATMQSKAKILIKLRHPKCSCIDIKRGEESYAVSFMM